MNEKLSVFHISVLVYMIQSGVALFSLPGILAENFGSNGWVIVPIISFIVMINIFLIGRVYKLGKGKSIFEILEQTMPKLLLYPIYLAIAFNWGILASLVGKQYVLIFQMIAFPTTNPMIFKVIVDILAFLLVTKGLYNISKASTVIFFLTVWMVFLEFFHFKELELARYTSFLFYEGKDFIKGSLETYTAFLGYELAILFFPFVNKRSKIMKGIYIGNFITTFVYLSVTLVCFGFYSYGQLEKMLFPVLDILAYVRLPFIERIENLLFTLFFLKILITTSLYYWGSQQVLIRIFKKTKEKLIVFIVIGLFYFISIYPSVLGEINKWLSTFAYIETGVAFALPVICLLTLFIHKVRSRNQNVQN